MVNASFFPPAHNATKAPYIYHLLTVLGGTNITPVQLDTREILSKYMGLVISSVLKHYSTYTEVLYDFLQYLYTRTQLGNIHF